MQPPKGLVAHRLRTSALTQPGDCVRWLLVYSKELHLTQHRSPQDPLLPKFLPGNWIQLFQTAMG